MDANSERPQKRRKKTEAKKWGQKDKNFNRRKRREEQTESKNENGNEKV